MATAAFPILLLALSFFAVSVSGRPCKTLFFYPTTTSSSPSFPQNPNPTLNTFTIQRDFSYSPKFFFLFFTTVHSRDDVAENRHPIRLQFRPRPAAKVPFIDYRSRGFPIRSARKELVDREEVGDVDNRLDSTTTATTMPIGLYSTMTRSSIKERTRSSIKERTRSSIKERTRDIMSVVCALFFGVGCGALTAATMCLIWSLFSPPRFDSDDEGLDNTDDDDETGPKKMGYVTIPHEDIDAVKKAAQAEALAKGIA